MLNLAGPGGINRAGGGPMISTGIMVIYADDESFSFMTPEGHMFAGMITFSASREEQDTVAQIQALVRASDPLYELTFRLGVGHKMEDDFWMQTLRNLAAYFKALRQRAGNAHGGGGSSPAVERGQEYLAECRHPHHFLHPGCSAALVWPLAARK